MRLARSSQRAYLSYIKLIEDEFGDLPVATLSDKRIRGIFKSWRDTFAQTPRKAGYAQIMLARIMSKDRGLIETNHCERGGRFYEADGTDKIWGEEDLAALLSVAAAEIQIALLLALWMGQRQRDLLRLSWSAYDGTHIRLRQAKAGRRIVALGGQPLRQVFDRTERRSPIILTNTYGRAWTSDGFRT